MARTSPIKSAPMTSCSPAADYAPLVVAYRNGSPVKMTDVATVEDDVENVRQAAWMNDTPSVIVNIQRQPGANVIAVVDRIKALLDQLTKSLPSSVQVTILTDRTTTIRASVADVEFELMLTVALVVMVIFLFLRNLAATVIPSVAVPLSLVGTFGVMYLLGYSLNNLSLMALTISTGFVVDDAIVMIENITRYIEEGEPALQAALKGSKQIGFTIVSLTISLIAVLIPLLFMGDIVGRLFREFAVTLAVTILVSAIVSLTLTPMMCSKLLKHSPEAEQSRFYRVTEHGWKAIISFYDRTLQVVLAPSDRDSAGRRRTLVLTVLLYIYIPKGFFPIQDTGVIQGVSEAAQTVSFQEMASEQQALGKIILKDPAVESLSSFIGIDGTNTTLNSGRILINLKPIDERKISASDVIRRLQPELARVPGITLYMQPVQDISVEDRVSRTQFQYTLEDPNADELDTFAPRMVEKLQELPELRDVASDQQVGGLRAKLVFDRNTAYRLGITPSTIDQTLYDAYGQREVSTIFTQLNQYHVVLEVKHGFSAESPGPPRPLHPHQRGHHRHRFDRIGIGSILHRLHVQGDARHAGQLRLQAADDVAGGDLALVDRLQVNQNAPTVQRGVGSIDANKRGQTFDGRILQNDLAQRLLLVGHFLERDRLRGFGNALDDPGILNREEPLGNVNIEKNREDQRPGGDHQSRGLMAQNHLERAVIEGNDGLPTVLGDPIEPGLIGFRGMLEQLRAHHGGERQRHDGGNQDGDRQSDGKLAEKRPTMSPMNKSGMSTAISEMVSETMVKPIWADPFSAA